MIDLGDHGIREKGCLHLSKLESERLEFISFYNNWGNEDIENRVGVWGKIYFEQKTK